MRYIEIEKLLRKRSEWNESNELWKNTKLRKDFRDYFFNKCWYTEVKLIGQDAHIDHFRPKAEIRPFEHYRYNTPLAASGYYWLKNDPSNYRLCCIYANRKTGEGGKGNFFPLADESPLLTEGGSEAEKPLLIDPCKHDDVALVSFMGNCVMAASMDSFCQMRVEVSSKVYNLTDGYIKTERAKVWNNVEKILAEYQAGDISRESCLRQLSEAVSREAQFSACAIACVNSLAPDDIKAELDLTI